MTVDHVLALAVFCLSITLLPGPNNALLMTCGLSHGFRRTLPAILGLTTGFAGMVVVVTLGLGALLQRYPTLDTGLKIAGVAYILYIAWRMTRVAPRTGVAAGEPMRFVEGMGTMCLNPQGWMFITSYVTAFTVRTDPLLNLAVLTTVCTLARFAGACFWTLSGAWLSKVLTSPAAVRGFTLAMAALMVLSLFPIVRNLARAWG